MSEFKRLRQIYPFDHDVLDRVEQAAYRQEGIDWPLYARRYDIPQPTIFHPASGGPIEVLDIAPYDYDRTIVYHQPMACELNPEIMLHVATFAAVQPELRVIAVGNPGRPGSKYGKVPLSKLYDVWKGDLQPAIQPTLEYLESQKIINEVDHIGESYGADKAAAAVEQAYAGRAAMIEPVSVAKAGLVKMGLIFRSTVQHKARYLRPVEQRSGVLVSAEDLTTGIYELGVIGRLSNLAIAHALGRGRYQQRLDTAMEANPDLKVGIAWGTASEFDRENQRDKITAYLLKKYSRDRVVRMPLKNETHAMVVDPLLNAAVYAQLLKETI